jgi:hypothetical protein
MPSFLISLIVSFVVRQIIKFGRDTDWHKVKYDAGVRIRELIPGEWFDDEFVSLAHCVIDAVSDALNDENNWIELLTLIMEKKWPQVLDLLTRWVKDGIGL